MIYNILKIDPTLFYSHNVCFSSIQLNIFDNCTDATKCPQEMNQEHNLPLALCSTEFGIVWLSKFDKTSHMFY